MKNKLSAFDRLMMAVTFAEAEDPETARRMMRDSGRVEEPEEIMVDADLEPLPAGHGYQAPNV